MLIQVNTDNNIENSEALIAHFTETLKDSFARFEEQLTRLEIHLSDENGSKANGIDKRCVLEARMKGKNPMAVTEYADTLHGAVKGASDKLRIMLEKALGHQRVYHA